MSNFVERIEEIVCQIIEDYELDYGNSEFYDQDGYVYISMEAPNSSMTTASIKLSNLNEEETDEQLRRSILWEMANRADQFDAEETFEEVWSPGFDDRSGVSVFGFVKMLEEDQEFFKEFANAARK